MELWISRHKNFQYLAIVTILIIIALLSLYNYRASQTITIFTQRKNKTKVKSSAKMLFVISDCRGNNKRNCVIWWRQYITLNESAFVEGAFVYQENSMCIIAIKELHSFSLSFFYSLNSKYKFTVWSVQCHEKSKYVCNDECVKSMQFGWTIH